MYVVCLRLKECARDEIDGESVRNVRLKKSNSVCILRQRVLVSARADDRVSVRVCVSGRLKSPRKV